MSGVRAALSTSEPTPVPPSLADDGVQAMQDILYDILANGMDPERSEVPMQEVERFLFEHARSAKSRDEFRAFFAEHGLSLRTNLAPEAAGLVLPPIEHAALPLDRDMPISVPVELAFSPKADMTTLLDDSERTGAHVMPRRRLGRALAPWAALACVAALLGLGGYHGYKTILELQGELQRTAQHSRDNQQALKALRDHAADLESSVAATGQLVQRMDQKSDLLINTLMPEDDGKSSRKRK
jgi:hypothetical protein